MSFDLASDYMVIESPLPGKIMTLRLKWHPDIEEPRTPWLGQQDGPHTHTQAAKRQGLEYANAGKTI